MEKVSRFLKQYIPSVDDPGGSKASTSQKIHIQRKKIGGKTLEFRLYGERGRYNRGAKSNYATVFDVGENGKTKLGSARQIETFMYRGRAMVIYPHGGKRTYVYPGSG